MPHSDDDKKPIPKPAVNGPVVKKSSPNKIQSSNATELDKYKSEIANLRQELEHRKGLQQALYKIANLAFKVKDSLEFYRNIQRILGDLFYAENFFVALVDIENQSLNFVYFIDEKDDRPMSGLVTPLKTKSLTTRVFKSNEALLLNLAEFEEEVRAGSMDIIGTQPVSWLGVPLKEDETPFGVMVVQSYREDIIFESWHRDLMEYVGKHVAVAILRERAKTDLEEKISQRTVDLEREIEIRKSSQDLQSTLYLIANLANMDLELESFFVELHKIIGRMVYCENFYIALKDETSQSISMAYYVDTMDDFSVETIATIPMERMERSLTGYVMRLGRSMLATNDEIKVIADNEGLELFGEETVSWLSVPLILDSNIVGVMTVQSYVQEHRFTEKDKELMIFVGQHVATALQRRKNKDYLQVLVDQRTEELAQSNIKLKTQIQETESAKKLQTALFKISETSQLCSSEEELYSQLHKIIVRMMKATSFFIALVDKENNLFRFEYVVDEYDDMIREIPIGKGLTSYVYEQEKIIHLDRDEIRRLEKEGAFESIGKFPTDWVGVPLFVSGEILGIMILQTYHGEYTYSEREIEILNFVSSHIAEALQRSRAERELKIANEDLADKTRKAEEASEAKSSFLATVSHEIRTPMNGVLGMLTLLSDTQLNRRQRDYVSKISTSANSLLGIINDILDFSKIEQGKLALDNIKFSLFEMMDNIIDLFSSRINEKQLTLNINLSPDIKFERCGDSLRLSQILINLVGNAVKFTEEGYIHIIIEEPAVDRLKVSVIDSGIGIERTKREKIFGSFNQADGTTTRRYGGSGLGLSICQQLVTMMEGSIEVSGRVGKGSCFSFEVFMTRDDSNEELSDDFSGAHILLISDNEFQVDCWQNFFNRFKVPFKHLHSEQVMSLNQAQQKLSTELSHIFIDDDITKYHGLDLIETVKETLTHQTPCFLLTQPSPHLSELPYLGSDIQLLPKPIKMGTIFRLIKNDFDVLQLFDPENVQKNRLRDNLMGRKILVAEDNPINQQVAKEILESTGAVVTIVENGQQAVAAVREYEYDLVLMDMQMPLMDGYQASDTIREDVSQEKLPIIAMTANVMKGDRERCLAHGMNDYIGKPIDRSKLFSIIEKNLHGSAPFLETPQEDIGVLELAVSSDKTSSKSFDINNIAQKYGSVELAIDLVNIFFTTHCDDVKDISALIEAGNYFNAERKVHKLKGSAGELGLHELLLQSEAIDVKLKQNLEPSLSRLQKFNSVLQKHLDEFKSIIESE